MLKCTQCSKTFSARRSLSRHVRTIHDELPQRHNCGECDDTFSRFSDLQLHIKRKHKSSSHPCPTCSNCYNTLESLNAHISQQHQEFDVRRYNTRPPKSKEATYYQLRDNFDGAMQVWRVQSKQNADLYTFKTVIFQILSYLIKCVTDKERAIKWHLRLTCLFHKATEPSEQFLNHFTTKVDTAMLLDANAIDKKLDTSFTNLNRQIEEFEGRGSGWVLSKCDFCDLYMARYKPIRGSSYIPLPNWLAHKKSVLNIENKGEDCFVLSVAAARYPALEHAKRPTQYTKHIKNLNTSMLSYPVSLDQIDGFEKANDFCIDIYGVDGFQIIPLKLSGNQKQECDYVALLLIEKNGKQHYCLIKDLDDFMRTTKHATYVCRRCLLSFNTIESRDKHKQHCNSNQVQQLPDDDHCHIEFNRIENMHRVTLVIYADIETVVRPIEGPQPNPEEGFTMPTAEHKVLLAYAKGVFQCCDTSTRTYIDIPIAKGEDAMTKLVEHFVEIGQDHQIHITHHKAQIQMREPDKQRLRHTNSCEFCSKPLTKQNKVRDHCHFCGKFRHVLCKDCNSKFRLTRNVHVYMHNFSGFDSTFVAPAMAKYAKTNNFKLECIAKEGDNFITIAMKIPYLNHLGQQRFWRLKFFDSLSFLPSSLSVLADSLKKEGPLKFQATIDSFGELSNLLMEKQVIPYSYFTDEAILNETKLPPIEAFTNDLTGKLLDVESYRHAQEVWNALGCKTLGDYYTIYLMCDVHLLIDVFESFRDFCISQYRLDPSRYVTGPSLSYGAMLLMTSVRLELIRDIEMWEMVCDGIRGGLSVVSNRIAVAKDGDLYDQADEPSTLYFVDAVNLYGYAMMQALASGNYRWLTQDEVNIFSVRDHSFDSKTGYLIKCDIEYPEHLHDAHNSCPLAPELMQVTEEMLSPYQRSTKWKQNSSSVSSKLIAHLGTRKNYVVDYRNLQLYLSLGLRLIKIHKILSFDQSRWMEKYIAFNTNMRKDAKSDFQKMLFKLMNNACFGKQLESPLKYKETIMCTSADQVVKQVKKPNYVGSVSYSDDLVCVSMQPTKVKLNKMRLVGCQITEIAKHRMQDYYYNCLYKLFDRNLSLCVHDTDSYLVQIKNDRHVYEKLKTETGWHDFSSLPENHVCFDISNKGVPGKLAPENNGKHIIAFAGIRAKCYAILFDDKQEKKRVKGISQHVRDNKLSFLNYFDCIIDNKNRRDVVCMLRRQSGQMYTLQCNKSSLYNYDDKRYLIDSLHSFARGHWSISR